MEFIRITVFTSMNRNTAIIKVREALSESNGWIVDQLLFSNIAATINFEMASVSLQQFQVRLLDEGLNATLAKNYLVPTAAMCGERLPLRFRMTNQT